MANTWKDFTFNQWTSFTWSEWEEFLWKITVAPITTGNNSIFLGTNLINATSDRAGRQKLRVTFTDSAIESGSKIVLGGLPLSLAVINQSFVLSVIRDTSGNFQDLGISSTYQGEQYAIKENNRSQYVLPITEGTGETTPASITTWQGIPLSLNMYNELILNEITDEPEEYETFFFGTLPLRTARIGSNRYLVVTE